MKDYIEIYTEDGRKEIMEAVCKFKLKKYNYNYLIYCELDKSHYYLAKYNNEDLSDLNTDFEDTEFNLACEVFENVVNL